MSPNEPYTYGGKSPKAARHQAVRRVYPNNPFTCLVIALLILAIASLLMGVDGGCSGCPDGSACSDYWVPGATASAYEKTAWVAGEALHAQLTLIATMQP